MPYRPEERQARAAANYLANKERINAQRKARVRTAEEKAAAAARMKKYQQKYPERVNEHSRKWKARHGYNSTIVAQRRLATLAGRERPDTCDVCGRGGKIVFDHHHRSDITHRCRTGNTLKRFRGWLCSGCNVALGMVEDNPEILRQLIDYLLRNNPGAA